MTKYKPQYLYFALALFNFGLGALVHSWVNLLIGVLMLGVAGAFIKIDRDNRAARARRIQRDLEYQAQDRKWENEERIMRGLSPLPEIPIAATITRKELKSQYEVD